ncbi:hypothetical protein, partial [Frankia gtarii]|uniref:hypothetical protein n=1 Tax=Frankia gtarii TaxID=2950102 RepID=UPI0021BEA74E
MDLGEMLDCGNAGPVGEVQERVSHVHAGAGHEQVDGGSAFAAGVAFPPPPAVDSLEDAHRG